jgi:acetylornithine deacetylase/succinyl-diaminopimelate desuccinylase-like protein
MYHELRERSDACREDLTVFAEQLLRTPSYSFREEAAAGLVQGLLEDLHYDLVFRDEAGNVVGVLAGSDEGPTVLLSSHIDTPRVEDEPAFPDVAPADRFEGRRLRGPGSVGSKSGAAAQIFAGHILDRSSISFFGTIVFAATVAQEEGNGAGIRHLMDVTLPKLGVKPDVAILGEPTGLLVCNGRDGWVDIDVTVTASDAAAAHRSAGAIHAAFSASASRGEWTGAKSSLHVSEPACRERGGVWEAGLRVRCRVIPAEAVTDRVGLVKKTALSAAEPLAGASIDVRVHGERRRFYTGKSAEVLCWSNPWSTDPSRPIVRRALDALAAAGWRDATTRTMGLESLRLNTAGSLLADGYRVPTICFGPGEESRTHTPDESVAIEDLVNAVFGTAVLIHGAIGAPQSLTRPIDRAAGVRGEIPMKRSGG